jgi:hypothetical protein
VFAAAAAAAGDFDMKADYDCISSELTAEGMSRGNTRRVFCSLRLMQCLIITPPCSQVLVVSAVGVAYINGFILNHVQLDLST